ncbi:MAG: aminoglycoside phosphotransferase family protein [Anaerolineales bacterium]|nr:aminoglycoside phosphotransferase family protein [Anaerolineales bacterium]
MLVPRLLVEHSISHIVMPYPTLTQTLWVAVDGFVMILYPFLEAETAKDAGLSDADWFALGATLRKIHTCSLPAELHSILPQETCIPWRRNVLIELETIINRHDLTDPAQLKLQAFWRKRQAEIHTLIERCDRLAAQLQHKALPAVLCHADIHTWNVLVDSARQWWIVDWDEVVLAPKEQDLMFMMGGIANNLVSAHQTACFLRGYGQTEIDSQALAYYRYAWAVQEMGAYAEEVFFSPERSEAARLDAVAQFISIFASGNIAEIALASSLDSY